MWDYDLGSPDDLLGVCEVPLATLAHGLAVRKWVRLERDADAAGAAAGAAVGTDDADGARAPARADGDAGRGAVHLKLRFVHSELGALLSRIGKEVRPALGDAL